MTLPYNCTLWHWRKLSSESVVQKFNTELLCKNYNLQYCRSLRSGDIIKSDFLNTFLFAESPFLHGVEDRLGGVILLKCIPTEGRGEFLWTHSSKTMCVSYKSDAERRPKVLCALDLYFLSLCFCNCWYGRLTTDIQSKTWKQGIETYHIWHHGSPL